MTKIFYSNINIFDIDKFESYETNLLIEDGIVSDIGRNINHDKKTEVIDLSNFYMLPGLVDSHGHMAHLGKKNKKWYTYIKNISKIKNVTKN